MTSCARLLTASVDDFFLFWGGGEWRRIDAWCIWLHMNVFVGTCLTSKQVLLRGLLQACVLSSLCCSRRFGTLNTEKTEYSPAFPHVDQGSNTCTHENKTKRQVRTSACRWYRGSVRLKTCTWILFTMKMRGK